MCKRCVGRVLARDAGADAVAAADAPCATSELSPPSEKKSPYQAYLLRHLQTTNQINNKKENGLIILQYNNKYSLVLIQTVSSNQS